MAASVSISSGDSVDDTNLVSVVIACHNHGQFLGQAIESVLAQNYRNFEIIVVDDGSTDNTGTVATRYRLGRYIYQENAGPSAARNAVSHSLIVARAVSRLSVALRAAAVSLPR